MVGSSSVAWSLVPVRKLLSAGDRGPQVAEDCNEPVKTRGRELNTLVYELYGLTEEEITVVERQNH